MAFAEGMGERPGRIKRKKQQPFNWKNIQDNGDGTYTAFDGRAKKLILKEYHRQGIRVRSKKQEDGTWIITPIGERQPRYARRQPAPRGSYAPRYSRQPRVRYLGPPPRLSPGVSTGGYAAPRRGPGGFNIGQRIDAWGKRRYEREIERHPYTVDEHGNKKLKPGWMEYTDERGNIKAVRQEPPKSFTGRLLEPRSQKEARKIATRQQQQKDWQEMERRSAGQPDTRIPGEEILTKRRQPPREMETLSRMKSSGEVGIRREQPPRPQETLRPASQPGIRTTAARATTPIPESVVPAQSSGPQTRSFPKLASDAPEIREERVKNLSGDEL